MHYAMPLCTHTHTHTSVVTHPHAQFRLHTHHTFFLEGSGKTHPPPSCPAKSASKPGVQKSSRHAVGGEEEARMMCASHGCLHWKHCWGKRIRFGCLPPPPPFAVSLPPPFRAFSLPLSDSPPSISSPRFPASLLLYSASVSLVCVLTSPPSSSIALTSSPPPFLRLRGSESTLAAMLSRGREQTLCSLAQSSQKLTLSEWSSVTSKKGRHTSRETDRGRGERECEKRAERS